MVFLSPKISVSSSVLVDGSSNTQRIRNVATWRSCKTKQRQLEVPQAAAGREKYVGGGACGTGRRGAWHRRLGNRKPHVWTSIWHERHFKMPHATQRNATERKLLLTARQAQGVCVIFAQHNLMAIYLECDMQQGTHREHIITPHATT